MSGEECFFCFSAGSLGRPKRATFDASRCTMKRNVRSKKKKKKKKKTKKEEEGEKKTNN